MQEKILNTVNTTNYSDETSMMILYAFYMGRSSVIDDYYQGGDSWNTVLYGDATNILNPHTIAFSLAMQQHLEELWEEQHPAPECA